MDIEKIKEKVLTEGETVEYLFGVSDEYINKNFMIFLIVGVPSLLLVGFGALLILWGFLYYKYYLKNSRVYLLTNRRVIIHEGLFSTQATSISYDKITDIEVQEGWLDKFLYKTGSLALNTAGTGLQEVVLKNIDRPYEVKKRLEALRMKGG